MALYMAIFMGGTPIGSPLIGWVGETFGARWTILLGGIVTLGTALVAVAWLVLARGVHVRYSLSAHPHLVVTGPPPDAERVAARAEEAARREAARQEVAAAQTRDDVSAA